MGDTPRIVVPLEPGPKRGKLSQGSGHYFDVNPSFYKVDEVLKGLHKTDFEEVVSIFFICSVGM